MKCNTNTVVFELDEKIQETAVVCFENNWTSPEKSYWYFYTNRNGRWAYDSTESGKKFKTFDKTYKAVQKYEANLLEILQNELNN